MNQRLPRHAVGIVEQSDDHVLIVRSRVPTEEGTSWTFPRGPVFPEESPESAMRRIIRAQWGVDVEIVTGQPPLVVRVDGAPTELRYFFCAISAGEVRSTADREFRFIPRAHLREYEFDEAVAEVARWLIDH